MLFVLICGLNNGNDSFNRWMEVFSQKSIFKIFLFKYFYYFKIIAVFEYIIYNN